MSEFLAHVLELAVVDEVILQNPWRVRAMVAATLGYTAVERVCEADHQAMLNGEQPQWGLPEYVERAHREAQP